MMEMTMGNALDHWVKLMMGVIKPPPKLGHHRRFIDGQFIESKDDSELVIINLIAKQGSLRAQDIVTMSGYKKTTVYRVLENMVTSGYLEIIPVRDLATEQRVQKHYRIRKKK
jgi:hypothetical protein